MFSSEPHQPINRLFLIRHREQHPIPPLLRPRPPLRFHGLHRQASQSIKPCPPSTGHHQRSPHDAAPPRSERGPIPLLPTPLLQIPVPHASPHLLRQPLSGPPRPGQRLHPTHPLLPPAQRVNASSPPRPATIQLLFDSPLSPLLPLGLFLPLLPRQLFRIFRYSLPRPPLPPPLPLPPLPPVPQTQLSVPPVDLLRPPLEGKADPMELYSSRWVTERRDG
jgi:hypothetical protein